MQRAISVTFLAALLSLSLVSIALAEVDLEPKDKTFCIGVKCLTVAQMRCKDWTMGVCCPMCLLDEEDRCVSPFKEMPTLARKCKEGLRCHKKSGRCVKDQY
ncbi:uncharacterized protein LOC106013550 [Aplysia californica]|uniref:Uncharacterized protein LOC106013550 n=1 Tax=Aplysia californica TaxID=6500 RepID=A0ABM1ACE4_APLCA|nr:uncharacterized protein LOC106013550 [Aplysia californica]